MITTLFLSVYELLQMIFKLSKEMFALIKKWLMTTKCVQNHDLRREEVLSEKLSTQQDGGRTHTESAGVNFS